MYETVCSSKYHEECVDYQEQKCYTEEENKCTDIREYEELIEKREIKKRRFVTAEENEMYTENEKQANEETKLTLCQDRDGKFSDQNHTSNVV